MKQITGKKLARAIIRKGRHIAKQTKSSIRITTQAHHDCAEKRGEFGKKCTFL